MDPTIMTVKELEERIEALEKGLEELREKFDTHHHDDDEPCNIDHFALRADRVSNPDKWNYG